MSKPQWPGAAASRRRRFDPARAGLKRSSRKSSATGSCRRSISIVRVVRPMSGALSGHRPPLARWRSRCMSTSLRYLTPPSILFASAGRRAGVLVVEIDQRITRDRGAIVDPKECPSQAPALLVEHRLKSGVDQEAFASAILTEREGVG